MDVNSDCVLPPFTQLLHHQIAGHKHGTGRTKLGLLKHNDGSVLKPLNSFRGEREISFYRLISESSKDDAVINELANFLPKYWGTWTAQFNNLNVKYLRLEDIADKFMQPCNLDIKIGAVTYDPQASVEKRKEEEEKYPEAEVIGFRILGMHVFDDCSRRYFSLNKAFGKSQTEETIIDGLHTYLNNENTCITLFIICSFIHRMKNIERWFSTQRRFAFYASSLLFFYEGKISLWLSELQEWKQLCSSNNTCLQGICSDQQTLSSELFSSSDDPEFLKNYLNDFLAKNFVFVGKKDVCPECYLNSTVCWKMQSMSSLVDVRMVDFAHVYDVQLEDKNYLFGLRKLIGFFQELQKKILLNCKTLRLKNSVHSV